MKIQSPSILYGKIEDNFTKYQCHIEFIFENILTNHLLKNSEELMSFFNPEIENYCAFIKDKQKDLVTVF